MTRDHKASGYLGVFVLAVVSLVLGGCSSVKVIEWTEDAKLSDGRLILVKRAEEYQRVTDVGAGFARGWLFNRSWIKADLPSPINRSIAWEGSLVPMVFDVVAGEVVMVGLVDTQSAEYEWRTPPGEHYVVLRRVGDAWQRIPLGQLPKSIQANLLGATHTVFIVRETASGSHVDLGKKAEVNAIPTIGENVKRIVRPR